MQKINPVEQAIQQMYNKQIILAAQKIKEWHLEKVNFINKFFVEPIEVNYNHLSQSQKQFQAEIHQLLNVINCQFQILNKMKKQQIKHVESHQIKEVNQNQNQVLHKKIFSTVLKKLSTTKTTMIELCQFSSKFFAIIGIQLNQMKSIYSQNHNRKERRSYDNKKMINQINDILQQICSQIQAGNNHKKNFKLLKIQQLQDSFQKQFDFHLNCLKSSRVLIKNDLQKKRNIFQNCIDNLQRYQQLYVKVFNTPLTYQIHEFFSKKIKNIEESVNQIVKNQQQNIEIQSQIKNQAKNYVNHLNRIMFQLLQNVTQTKFKIIYQKISSHKNSQSINVNVNESTQIIPQKEQLLTYYLVLTLTLDKKIIIISSKKENAIILNGHKTTQNDKQSIEFIKIQNQFSYNDCKVSQPDKDGNVLIKIKKKEKILVQFCSTEKQDEFFLHFNHAIN